MHNSNSFQLIMESIADIRVRSLCKMLYEEVPAYALSAIPKITLVESCHSMMQLMQKRSIQISCVNFVRLTKDVMVIEIITSELPFLVESIRNEIKKHAVDLMLVVHRSLRVERKKDGSLEHFSISKNSNECVMQFFVSNTFDEDYQVNIKYGIKNVIECIMLAAEDTKSMRQIVKDAIKNISHKVRPAKSVQCKESVSFLEWLLADHFIFLGSVTIQYEDGKYRIDLDNHLGIAKNHLYKNEFEAKEADDNECMEHIVSLRKSESRSVVHKDSNMNCVYIKQFKDGAYQGLVVLVGFFTSLVYRESIRNIPLLNTKINDVLARYGYSENSQNSKELVQAIESLSRTDLMQIDKDELFEIATGIMLLNLVPQVKLFLRRDVYSQLITCMILIPKEKFHAAMISLVERILTEQLCGTVITRYINVGESQLARLQIILKPFKALKKEYSVKKIEDLIKGVISVWTDDLFNALNKKYDSAEALELYNQFKDVFDSKYMNSFAPEQAVHDIKMMQTALQTSRIKADIYLSAKSGKEFLQLKIFSPHNTLPLSGVLPVIENFGFFVSDNASFTLVLKNHNKSTPVFIYQFRLSRSDDNVRFLEPSDKQNIEEALEMVFDNKIKNDKFNALMVNAGIKWQGVFMLRAYAAYLKQIAISYSRYTVIESLMKYSHIVKKLVNLFNVKFALDGSAIALRLSKITSLKNEIQEALSSVNSLAAEKVFKEYLEVILATQRTNLFQNFNKEGLFVFAFKIHCEAVSFMPLPKPFMEIFVYSKEFEALHIRGGKIARGGIRWSDRDDFRTEILGLMKAQMTKNAVIVPVGSKGGFLLKEVQANSPDFQAIGIKCYKNFLRGVLDLTDNIIDNKVIHPENVVIYDQEDPYLVVAADKGTSSFSDYANAVSKEYSFWLDDAFASGGSAGYDHKKIAITARGAFISAQDHAMRFGMDLNTQPFTAIGIGDMSGDVFGNGLLLSNQYQLIAAFNHMHIFIDPSPDTEASFNERKRLFTMPNSKWSDYNEKLISKGGGVFLRSAKSIEITPQMAKVLDINAESLAPTELIQAILKAPLDIIWNGGIGTYIKASSESNISIGDKNNDSLRINGADLRCKAFIEGGNLGCTQLGRIEYAKCGHSINTDFIDNSAGVDCSDHEVNIKIAFADLLQKKLISIEERDKALLDMTEDVTQLVLNDNKNQTLLISLEQNRGSKRLGMHFWLMKNLESRGELNRELEKLPSADDFSKIATSYGKLTRPEIAVLIAYAKNAASHITMSSGGTIDKALEIYLIEYFPKIMREKFQQAILSHKLKKEIIVTTIVNHFVNILGCCAFHRLIDQGHNAIDILHAFFISSQVLSSEAILKELKEISHIMPAEQYLAIINCFSDNIEKMITWLLNNQALFMQNVEESIKLLSMKCEELYQIFEGNGNITRVLSKNENNNQNLSQYLQKKLQRVDIICNELTNVMIAYSSGASMQESIEMYMKYIECLQHNVLMHHLCNVEIFDYQEEIAFNLLLEELNTIIANFVIMILQSRDVNITDIDIQNYVIFVDEIIKNLHSISVVSSLVLIAQRLRDALNCHHSFTR